MIVAAHPYTHISLSSSTMSLAFSFAESAISGAFKSFSPFTKDKPTGNINWGEYNYPPCLSIIHFDEDDLSHETLKKVVRMMHRVFLIVCGTCCLNLLDTIIDASFYPQAKWEWTMYSALNLVLLPPMSLYVFFTGYKGLAVNDMSMLQKYSVIGTIQSIFLFLFTIMPFGATNGLLTVAMVNPGIYWAIAVVVESSFWVTAFGMSIYSVVFVVRGDYNVLPIATRIK